MDLDISVVERSYVKQEAQGSMPGSDLYFCVINRDTSMAAYKYGQTDRKIWTDRYGRTDTWCACTCRHTDTDRDTETAIMKIN